MASQLNHNILKSGSIVLGAVNRLHIDGDTVWINCVLSPVRCGHLNLTLFNTVIPIDCDSLAYFPPPRPGVCGAGQQHGSVYWRTGADCLLEGLREDRFLHDQLGQAFSLQVRCRGVWEGVGQFWTTIMVFCFYIYKVCVPLKAKI